MPESMPNAVSATEAARIPLTTAAVASRVFQPRVAY